MAEGSVKFQPEQEHLGNNRELNSRVIRAPHIGAQLVDEGLLRLYNADRSFGDSEPTLPGGIKPLAHAGVSVQLMFNKKLNSFANNPYFRRTSIGLAEIGQQASIWFSQI
jgi:hypothetical protein